MEHEITRTVESWKDNPTIDDPVWAREDVEFHETGVLSDGTRVGRVGSKWYVLEDGSAVSRGYHEIHVGSSRLVGVLGASRKPVSYPGRGR